MQRNYHFFRIISFILTHAFLLFDATWAGGFQSSSTASVTCLNAPLQISNQSLAETVAKMLPAAQPRQSLKDSNNKQSKSEINWPHIFKVASATVALLLRDGMSSALGFFDRGSIESLGWFMGVAIMLGTAVSVLFIIGRRIGEWFDRYLKGRKAEMRGRKGDAKAGGIKRRTISSVQAKTDVGDITGGDKQAQWYRQTAAVAFVNSSLKSLEMHLRFAGAKEILAQWKEERIKAGGYAYLQKIFKLSGDFIAAQGATPAQLKMILKLAEKLSRWKAIVDEKKYDDAKLLWYVQLLAEANIDTPKKAEVLNSVIDDEIALLESRNEMLDGRVYSPKSLQFIEGAIKKRKDGLSIKTEAGPSPAWPILRSI